MFLDRDDTLMAARSLPAAPSPCAPGDVIDPELVRALPGARESCEALKRAGWRLIVVSNQGVVARGGAGIELVRRVNEALQAQLGGVIDAWYFCPFHPAGAAAGFAAEHEWRKPGPGMILAAAAELSIDVRDSWLIGDAQRDVDAGVAAGLARQRCLLLGRDAPDIRDAAGRILGG